MESSFSRHYNKEFEREMGMEEVETLKDRIPLLGPTILHANMSTTNFAGLKRRFDFSSFPLFPFYHS